MPQYVRVEMREFLNTKKALSYCMNDIIFLLVPVIQKLAHFSMRTYSSFHQSEFCESIQLSGE